MYDERKEVPEKTFSPICPDFGEDFTSEEPIYPLSSDQRLSHLLTHGTNNQVVDFRSGIYAGIQSSYRFVVR